MKTIEDYGMVELQLEEARNIEGGMLRFDPMHIYFPRNPVINRWKPFQGNKLMLWS